MATYPPKVRQQDIVSSQEESTNRRISPRRKEKLLNLKKREELKDVLVQKLKEKYHAQRDQLQNVPDNVSERSAVIKHEVDRFLGRADVTESNLNRLERRIFKKTNKPSATKDFDASSVVSGVSSYSNHSVKTEKTEKSMMSKVHEHKSEEVPVQSSLEVAGSSVPLVEKSKSQARSEAGEVKGLYDWSRLDEYAQYLHEQDTIRNKISQLEYQAQLRKDLDRQINDVRSRKIKDKVEDSKYFENQAIELDQWKVYENKVTEEKKRKAMNHNPHRDDQLMFNKARKETELKTRLEEETQLLDRITEEILKEKQKIVERKIQQKEQMKIIMNDNIKDRVIKDEARKKQIENDIAMMENYNRMLDAQDAKRAAELKARVERQKMLIEKMKQNVIQQQNDRSNDDALRADRQKQEADARAIELSHLKEQRLREMKQETQRYLFQQMKERQERLNNIKNLKAIQSKILLADTQEYTLAENKKKELRKLRNEEFKQELLRQIALKEERMSAVNKYEMSQSEKKINKQLMDVVNKTLHDRDEELANSGDEHH